MTAPEVRRGMPETTLGEEEFKRRFRSQFQDPAFDGLVEEMGRVSDAAWQGYSQSRKSPRTHAAGPGFADPGYQLSDDWRAARDAIGAAQRRHDDLKLPSRILLINSASRSEHTCPGEMSKTFRLVEIAREAILAEGSAEVDVLDLSRLASEYGRRIHPCKTCFSTAAALCHWPCSCYPNYALGQTQDWMNDIYPLWVAAHGVLIVTPVNWYHTSSPLKLMIDRLVCADGGNPDPTLTQGKDAAKAKEIELGGWPYPRHLAGRLFGVVVHGDAEGARGVRNALSDWLSSMELRPAASAAELDRYIGYWQPYATSHAALDADEAVMEEVRNAGRALARALVAQRSGTLADPDRDLEPPRQK